MIMKIALLGTGFGQAHAAAYAARGDVEVVIFGRDPDKTAKASTQFGFDHSTTMDAAFEDASFDLVDICLPNLPALIKAGQIPNELLEVATAA